MIQFSESVSSSLPRTLQDAVILGIEEALGRGALLGYPLMNLRLTVTAASASDEAAPADAPVDQSSSSSSSSAATAAAFRACASRVLGLAVEAAEPVLLEPIMAVSIEAKPQHAGVLLADLASRRRATVKSSGAPSEEGQEQQASDRVIIEAEVPLAEMVGYATDLRSKTQGTASFSMEPLRYAPVPPHIFVALCCSTAMSAASRLRWNFTLLTPRSSGNSSYCLALPWPSGRRQE